MSDSADAFLGFLAISSQDEFTEWVLNQPDDVWDLAYEGYADSGRGFMFTQDGQRYAYVPASRIEGLPADLTAELTERCAGYDPAAQAVLLVNQGAQGGSSWVGTVLRTSVGDQADAYLRDKE